MINFHCCDEDFSISTLMAFISLKVKEFEKSENKIAPNGALELDCRPYALSRWTTKNMEREIPYSTFERYDGLEGII